MIVKCRYYDITEYSRANGESSKVLKPKEIILYGELIPSKDGFIRIIVENDTSAESYDNPNENTLFVIPKGCVIETKELVEIDLIKEEIR